MISSVLVNPANNNILSIGKNVHGDDTLLVETYNRLNGTFKAATRSSAGTTIIVEPDDEASIQLTDLILTTDKVALADVTVRFTDGTNTIDIITADVADAPVNLAIAFAGRWAGWKDARVEMVTVAAVTATVAIGYIKVPQSLTIAYDTWDALR